MGNTRIYAIYKDGEIYKVSWGQNTPFYDTMKGAKAAMRILTSKKCLPSNIERDSLEAKAYIEKQKKRYVIKEFCVVEKGEIG